jgi:hypothetical protein
MDLPLAVSIHVTRLALKRDLSSRLNYVAKFRVGRRRKPAT